MQTNKNAVINKGCHSQEFLLGIFHVLSRYVHKGKNLYTNDLYVEDPRLRPSGMTTLSNKTARGFTLIELLVVVLIIGILAAVAVPQYQATTDKALVSTYLPVLKSIRDAQELYYLDHGEYAAQFASLDIDVTKVCPSIDGANKNMLFKCKGGGYINNAVDGAVVGELSLVLCPSKYHTVSVYDYVDCARNSDAVLAWYFNHHVSKPGKKTCSTSTKRGKRICNYFLND